MIRAEIQPGVWLDARRAVYFETERLLVVSDLHWGYAASHRATGNLLPDWGDPEIAAHLRTLLTDYQPARMLWLGDSLHTLRGRHAAEAFLSPCEVPVTILRGNHDARWTAASTPFLQSGAYFFHHGDTAQPIPPEACEVIGHHHPAFAWSDGAGGRIKLPALVWSARRLILPAFSPWAAGTPWNRALTEEEKLWAIAPRRIFPVTATLLRKQAGLIR